MEFEVRFDGWMPDLEAIGDAIRSIDPAAIADIDPDRGLLRVAAGLDAAGLRTVLEHAGYPVPATQVRQLPSICCGGCSG